MLTHGSLFTGVGGFDLAFERQGVETKWQVEIDKAARSVLAHHWPDTKRCEDIRTVGRHNLEYVDIISGGFPCQNLSVAGKREGLAGSRSGLFYEMVRVIDEIKPKFVIFENVPGILSSDQGRDFGRVINSLADIGYCGAYRTLDARFFGVPQRRRRVFGVFACGDIGADDCAEILAVGKGVPGNTPKGRAKGQDTAGTIGNRIARSHTELDGHGAYIPLTSRCVTPGEGGRLDGESYTFIPMAFSSKDYGADAGELSPTLRALNFDKSHVNGGGQVAVATFDPINITAPCAVRRLTPRECERLQGFPDDWTLYISDGKQQADTQRYRQMGNAVAVPCVEYIARRMVVFISSNSH